MAYNITDIGTGLGYAIITDSGSINLISIIPNIVANKNDILKKIRDNVFKDNAGNVFYENRIYLDPVTPYVSGVPEAMTVAALIPDPPTEDISDLLDLVGTGLITGSDIAATTITLANMAADSIDENKIVSTTFGDGVTGGSGANVATDPDTTTLENTGGGKIGMKDGGTTLAKLAADSVDENKIVSTTLGDGVTGGSGVVLSVDPDGTTLENSGGKVQIKALGVDSGQIAASAVTISKVTSDIVEDSVELLLSVDTAGDIGDIDFEMPFACDVDRITYHVIELIEASNAATVTAYSSDGFGGWNLMAGPKTITAGSVQGTEFSEAAPANNSFTKGLHMRLSTAKVTPGGKLWMVIHVTKT